MPNETFLNLSKEKQQRIERILVDKFYARHISQVKVSEIVAEMNMSRGAFYKYFIDLEDAYSYMCKTYSLVVHGDILAYINQNQDDFFQGIESYLIWCSQLNPASDYWKGLQLLTSSNLLSNHQRPSLSSSKEMLDQWMLILRLNKFTITSERQGISFLYFIMDLVMNTLTELMVNHWSKEELLVDFRYRKQWILHGISKESLT